MTFTNIIDFLNNTITLTLWQHTLATFVTCLISAVTGLILTRHKR